MPPIERKVREGLRLLRSYSRRAAPSDVSFLSISTHFKIHIPSLPRSKDM